MFDCAWMPIAKPTIRNGPRPSLSETLAASAANVGSWEFWTFERLSRIGRFVPRRDDWKNA
jgi:hypothetical protein